MNRAAPEYALHVAVAKLARLNLAPGWRFTHIASGELRAKSTAGRLTAMGVEAGWPDLIFVSPKGISHFIEVKAPKGRMSPAQTEFREWAQRQFIPHAVVTSVEEALVTLEFWGAIRHRARIAA